MSQISFPYAVSRIKASESSFIDNNLWSRLWEASTEEAYRLLHDIGYGKTAKNTNNIDDLTKASLNEARELIKEISPDPNITDLYLLQVDGHNIKVMLKGLLQREDVERFLLPGGTLSVEEIKQSFEEDNFDAFPLYLKEAVENFDPSEAPGLLSAKIDNAVYKQIFHTLSNKKISSPLSEKFFNSRVDFTNILTVLRANHLGWSSEQMNPMIIPQGQIERTVLDSALNSDETQIVDILSVGDYGVKIREALSTYFNTQNIANIENTFFRLSFNIIQAESYDSFGIGPILNYLLQKEFEARTLRVLFLAKRTNKEVSLSDLGVEV